MTMQLTTIQAVLVLLAGVGTVVGGGGLAIYLWGKYREGKSDGKKSTIELMALEITELRKLIEAKDAEHKKDSEANRSRIEERGREISRLQGILEQKEHQNDQLREILQGRDPKMLQVLTDLHALMVRIETKLDGWQSATIKP